MKLRSLTKSGIIFGILFAAFLALFDYFNKDNSVLKVLPREIN